MILQATTVNLEQSCVDVEIKLGFLDKSGDIISLKSCTNPLNSFMECEIAMPLSSSTYFDSSDYVSTNVEQHTIGFGSKLLCKMGYTGGGSEKHGQCIFYLIEALSWPFHQGIGYVSPPSPCF